MIDFLKAQIKAGLMTHCDISQRGGGMHRNVEVRYADEIGVVASVDTKIRFIPWTSINEIGPRS